MIQPAPQRPLRPNIVSLPLWICDPAGAPNLLMKPFTADTLASRIKDLMAGMTQADGRRA